MDRRQYLRSLGGATGVTTGSGIVRANWWWDLWGGPTVDVQSGTVEGETVGETDVFRGIPYAEQPTGERRWRPPQTPAQSWDGTRDATEYGPICAQRGLLGSLVSAFGVDATTVEGSERCLNLNVWTPTDADAGNQKPVMVWIHGGGYRVGSNRYDCQALSEAGDVVVVAINYRLGPLGFFTHPDLLAEDERNVNQGYQDMIAALEWVQRNVRAFGGDPDNVTIFGESAGGNAVLTLMTDPKTEGLFDRVICQSGPVVNRSPTREADAQVGVQYADRLGCGGSTAVECMRRKSPKDVLAASEGGLIASVASGDDVADLSRGFGVTVDGTVIEKHPAKRFRDGEFHDVPLITGTNAEETQLFLLRTDVPSAREYERTVRERYPDRADEILERYPVSDYETPKQALVDVTTDAAFQCGDRLVSKWIAENGGTVYRYLFDDTPSKPFIGFFFADDVGAYHAAEMAYVFGGAVEQRGVTLTEIGERDRPLSRTIQDYWTTFAHSGDPNNTRTADWPSFTVGTQGQVRLTEDGVVPESGEKSACALWESYYRDQIGL